MATANESKQTIVKTIYRQLEEPKGQIASMQEDEWNLCQDNMRILFDIGRCSRHIADLKRQAGNIPEAVGSLPGQQLFTLNWLSGEVKGLHYEQMHLILATSRRRECLTKQHQYVRMIQRQFEMVVEHPLPWDPELEQRLANVTKRFLLKEQGHAIVELQT